MRVSSKNRAGFEDGPEEGEIVSDDLEDISDVSLSLSPHKTGKSHFHSDNLLGLSLSSVSDSDGSTLKVRNRTKRKKSYSHRNGRQKKNRRKPPESDSSDDDDSLETCRLKLQLKATVQLDSNETHRNSLRTRLKAMTRNSDCNVYLSDQDLSPKTTIDVHSTPDPPVTIIDLVEHDTSSCIESVPENIDNDSNSSKNDDLDTELIHLRLEALKTAIKNKYPNGAKSKKAIIDDANKENSSNNSEKDNNTELGIVPESPGINSNSEHKSNTSPEEDDDVDVLRALLLASMSRKMTEIECAPQLLNKPMPQQNNNINSNNIQSHKFKINNNVRNIFNTGQKDPSHEVDSLKPLNIPPVKPLIICVNSDSDSEWELSSGSPEKSPKKFKNVPEIDNVIQNTLVDSTGNKVETAIENTIERFLKEQRAKVEHLSINKPEPCINTVKVSNKCAPRVATAPNTKECIAKPNAKTIITALPKTTKITPTSQQPKKTAISGKVVSGGSKLDIQLELEKSALKFLPANKREEYRQLQDLLRQKKAQISKTRIKKSAGNSAPVPQEVLQKTLAATKPQIQAIRIKETNKAQQKLNTDAQSVNVKTTNLGEMPAAAFQTKANNERVRDQSTQTVELEVVKVSQKTEARLKEFRSQELIAEKRNKEMRQRTQSMRDILKQLQIKRNGRLQMEEKYNCLRPLIKKLNGVNKEQKDCEQEVEKLFNQVTEVRKKQKILHSRMLESIKQLADNKTNIDLSISSDINSSNLGDIVTSTPIKLSPANNSNGCNALTSPCPDITVPIQSNLTDGLNALDNKECIIDPNDIDQIIKKTQEQVAVLECRKSLENRLSDRNRYISPLDNRTRLDDLDPFAIICPFEVNGTCKDPDCSFNHLPR